MTALNRPSYSLPLAASAAGVAVIAGYSSTRATTSIWSSLFFSDLNNCAKVVEGESDAAASFVFSVPSRHAFVCFLIVFD